MAKRRKKKRFSLGAFLIGAAFGVATLPAAVVDGYNRPRKRHK